MMRRAQPALGTLVDICILDALDTAQSMAAFQAGFAAIHHIHQLMSFHAPDSDISRYNQAATGSLLKLHTDTTIVLAAAQRLAELSAGIFDIRVASRLVALDYLPAPDHDAIPAYAGGVQAYRILSDRQVEKLTPDWLDVGGIAKGYAVDITIAALWEQGVRNACVNAGGDLRVLGQGQTVVIRDPLQPQLMAKQLVLTDQAMATSASYFSGKEFSGEPVSALINGSTGRALAGERSYTVIAPACIWADGLTKVVAASGNAQHPCLQEFTAIAFII